ncbi:hypothetical protein LZ31DRAFT_239658 [Colletotrichum somersetense]|nr:hypothetical protein LZ31DRAFT_239658 [Colletotrichum somersetense]
MCWLVSSAHADANAGMCFSVGGQPFFFFIWVSSGFGMLLLGRNECAATDRLTWSLQSMVE